ncbi:MAG: division/cell wall cluster transcriptional repressor MraZ [bacterium]|nr:division/cell wall cluster transcriptional repressor MraZ [bacterium]
MFLGEYYTTFTGHNRVILPKKFRQELGGKRGVVLSRGLEGCIWGFSLEEWQKEASKQLETPVTERSGRDLRRYLFSAAEEVRLDDQGRLVVPGNLREYAQLKGGVVIIGAGDHFEIWEGKEWEKLLKGLTKKEKLDEFGKNAS